jgi:hypothetical protein
MHNIKTIKKPASMPKLNFKPFLNPAFFALFMAMIVFNPGKKDTIITFARNEKEGNMISP